MRTPTPWHAPGLGEIHNAEHILIAAAMPFENGDGMSDLPMNENAEFIVRACNCHDELVAALREVMNEYRDGYGLHCVEQVRAALAKAEAA